MKGRTCFFVAILISIIFSITTQVYSAEISRTTRVPTRSKQSVLPSKQTVPQQLQHDKFPTGTMKPVFPDRPDLAFITVRIMANENLGFGPGQSMPIAATISNNGKIVSPSFSVNFAVRGGPQSQNTPIYTTTVSLGPIQPNMANTANFTVTLNNAVPGEGDIEVIIDPQNTVPEMNEANNTWHKRFFIHGP